MQFKGRHWVVLWLALFLVVAGSVIARQSSALRISRELSRLKDERASLEARKAELERRIRQAESRQVLIDRARRAGLRQPEDSELMLLPWPPPVSKESR
jgi:cell division protein FtsL